MSTASSEPFEAFLNFYYEHDNFIESLAEFADFTGKLNEDRSY